MKKLIIIMICGLSAISVTFADGAQQSQACTPPKPNGGTSGTGKTAQSCDPNEISGPLGTGEKRYVQQGEWMDYTIYFENMTNATAAAQEVFVDLPMDPNLDWSTLELGEISFGDHIDTSLVGKSHGKASYAMPGTNTSVKTEVTIKDGVLSWYIRDWDPTTADNFPASATGGFLPPNDPDTHSGEGHLSFRVRVKSDAPDGAVINASATIVFDSNAPIETDPSWWNTVGTFHDVELEIDGVTTNLTLIAGEQFGELPTPNEARTGYTFDAWYTGENGTGTKATPDALVPAGDFSLYANWIANKYLIAYNANGGEGEMQPQTNTYDLVSCLTSNAFTRTSYRFLGWATNETGEVVYENGAVVSNLTSAAGGVIDLYAAWELKTVVVSFDTLGGTPTPTNRILVVDASYGELPKVERTGFTFDGWVEAQDLSSAIVTADTIVTNETDFTLHAYWTANGYMLDFDANGGTTAISGKYVSFCSEIGELPVPVRSGYAFDGWYIDGVKLTAATVWNIADDATATARWTVNTYTVTFNANGGEGEMPNQTNTYDLVSCLTSNAFTRAYYDFTGWATSAAGAAVYGDGAIVSNLTDVAGGEVLLFAKWVRQNTSVIFGDSDDAVATQLEVGLPYGDRLRDPEARDGCTFGGWFTGPNGTGKRITSESIVEQGINRLYANWIANAYTVRFNANGGTGTMADQAFVYGMAQKLSVNAFKHGMYAFVGWATKPDGEVVYADGQLVENLTASANGVVTLYAVWTMDRPMLFTEVTEAAPQTAASVYDGYLYNKSTGALAGTIQVKVGKPGKDGKAAVKATVVGLDGKKKSLKAMEKGKALIENDGTTTVELVGGDACEVKIGAKGMSGWYGSYDIDGALNVFASKDAADKAAAAAVLGKWQGVVNVAWQNAGAARSVIAPYQTLSVTIANKGKAKVAGTLADGTKVSASSQLLVGDEWCCVPVLEPKKSHLAFVLWLPKNGGSAVVTGLADAVVGKPGTLKSGAEFRMNEVLGDAKYADYLPNGVPVTGGAKWVLPKAGKVQLAKDGLVDAAKLLENPSALKLTYTAKTGAFKGSFKAYSDVRGKPKGVTVNVVGVLVDGVGYGAATIKKVGSVPVTISAR